MANFVKMIPVHMDPRKQLKPQYHACQASRWTSHMPIDWTRNTQAHDQFQKCAFLLFTQRRLQYCFQKLALWNWLQNFSGPQTSLSCKWTEKMHKKFYIFHWNRKHPLRCQQTHLHRIDGVSYNAQNVKSRYDGLRQVHVFRERERRVVTPTF